MTETAQNATSTVQRSFKVHRVVGLALDPIHVGTGGARLGRVDNTIVRDPVTRLPKLPGSSLAGVYRAYTAMAMEDERGAGGEDARYYPTCAGTSSCGKDDCEICSVFGTTSRAGLAAFSDAELLLFPVPTRHAPRWVTSPACLARVGLMRTVADERKAYAQSGSGSLNLGWLQLKVANMEVVTKDELSRLGMRDTTPCGPEEIVLVSDKLLAHLVNSNLEVRTSVAIDPATGAAAEGKLFTYEALPRGTVLVWEITARDPRHFRRSTPGAGPGGVYQVVKKAHDYLKALGVGGMSTRGMGRLEVLASMEVPR